MKRIMVTDTRSHFVQCWPHHGGKYDVKRCAENNHKKPLVFLFHIMSLLETLCLLANKFLQVDRKKN